MRVSTLIVTFSLTIATPSILAEQPAAQSPYPIHSVHRLPFIKSQRAETFATKKLDAEVIALLKEQAARVLLRCGKSDYLLIDGQRLEQVKNVRLVAYQDPLDETENLNGQEWMGNIAIEAQYGRTLEGYALQGPQGWGEWGTGSQLYLQLERSNGKWLLDGAWTTGREEPLTCELADDLINGRKR